MENKNEINLSIVMPCYNCISTVEESLRSVYDQNFSYPFEVVMVDDGSTDGTGEFIKKLSNKYQNIKLIFHGTNKGGGAARNTGIKAAQGKLIFILDSDDILPPNMLPKMINHLETHNCDGVIFAETCYFYGKINYARKKITNYNLDCKQPITLSDLFDQKKGHLTAANFLFTKESFLKTSGYPENHGFDTQCFGIRYLSKNLKVLACPNSFYYHRKANKKSYFERIYENGELSKNFYLIFEDIIYLFSSNTIKKIMDYDIFKNTDQVNNIKKFVEEQYLNDQANFFRKNLEKYMKPDGFDIYLDEFKNSDNFSDVFCIGIYYYKKQNYDLALNYFKKLITNSQDKKIVYFNLIRSLVGLSKKYNITQIETKTIELIDSLKLLKVKGRMDEKNPISILKNTILNKYPKYCEYYAKIKKIILSLLKNKL